MDNKVEKLDLKNVIEIQQIQGLLKDHKRLKEFFNDLLKSVNKNLNNEPVFSPRSDSDDDDDENFEMILESDDDED